MTNDSKNDNARRSPSASRKPMTGGVARARNKRDGITFHPPTAADHDPAASVEVAATPQRQPDKPEEDQPTSPIESTSATLAADEPLTSSEPEGEASGHPVTTASASDAASVEEEEPATCAPTTGIPACDEPVGGEPAGTAEAKAEPTACPEPKAEARGADPERMPATDGPSRHEHHERHISPQDAAAAARRGGHVLVEVDAASIAAPGVGATLLGPFIAATSQKLARQSAAKRTAEEETDAATTQADTAPSAQPSGDEPLQLDAEPVPYETDDREKERATARKPRDLFGARRPKRQLAADQEAAAPDELPDGKDVPRPDGLPGDGASGSAPALESAGPDDSPALPPSVPASTPTPAREDALDPRDPQDPQDPQGPQEPFTALPLRDEAAYTPALETGTWRDNAFGHVVNRLLAGLIAFFGHLGHLIKKGWRHYVENPGVVRRAIKEWFHRVAGAAHDGSFSSQPEEYASGRTSRDFMCNMLGIASFGALFPLLTVVVTQIVGVEQAGMFSLSFVAGSLFLIIANFGMRPYQVSDINEEHSFADYRVHRFCVCLIMAVVGALYCLARGYSGTMLSISIGVYGYKLIEGLADVYEGRLQQKDKLYLAGISQTIRSVGAFIVFTVVLLISHNLAAACIALPITGLLTFYCFTFPLAKLETPKSPRFRVERVIDLFKQCTPLFVSLFLYTLIDYMPVFVMEGVLSYDNQLYYNAMYFPAQAIAVGLSVVYKPLLLRIANLWADRARRKLFDIVTISMIALIVLVTALVVLIMGWIGIPIMSFMYGLDFEQFRYLVIIFLIAGGITSIIDFLYQIAAILRCQQNIMMNYLITFGFSLFVPTLLVNFTGLPGAVIGYLIVMCILLVLTGTEYVRIRMNIAQEEADEAAQVAQHEEQQRRRWTARFRTRK